MATRVWLPAALQYLGQYQDAADHGDLVLAEVLQRRQRRRDAIGPECLDDGTGGRFVPGEGLAHALGGPQRGIGQVVVGVQQLALDVQQQFTELPRVDDAILTCRVEAGDQVVGNGRSHRDTERQQVRGRGDRGAQLFGNRSRGGLVFLEQRGGLAPQPSRLRFALGDARVDLGEAFGRPLDCTTFGIAGAVLVVAGVPQRLTSALQRLHRGRSRLDQLEPSFLVGLGERQQDVGACLQALQSCRPPGDDAGHGRPCLALGGNQGRGRCEGAEEPVSAVPAPLGGADGESQPVHVRRHVGAGHGEVVDARPHVLQDLDVPGCRVGAAQEREVLASSSHVVP